MRVPRRVIARVLVAVVAVASLAACSLPASPKTTAKSSSSAPVVLPSGTHLLSFGPQTSAPSWNGLNTGFVPLALGYVAHAANQAGIAKLPEGSWKIVVYPTSAEPKDRLACTEHSEWDFSNGNYPYVIFCGGHFVLFEVAFGQSGTSDVEVERAAIRAVADALASKSANLALAYCYQGALAQVISTSSWGSATDGMGTDLTDPADQQAFKKGYAMPHGCGGN